MSPSPPAAWRRIGWWPGSVLFALNQKISNGSTSSDERKYWLIFVLLLILSLVVRGIFFIEPPGRDQSLFLTQANLLNTGSQLYAHIWEHKPPGVIVLYAAAMKIFGANYEAIHIFTWLNGLVVAFILFFLVLSLGGRMFTATVSSCLYLIYFSGVLFGGYWATAQAEVFMDPFSAASIFLVVKSMKRENPQLQSFFVIGTLVSIVIFLKYSALPFSLIVLPAMMQGALSWRKRIRMFVAYGIGLAWLLLVFLVYLYATHRLSEFWTATIVFNQAHMTMANSALFSNPLRGIFFRFWPLLPFYGFAVIAVVKFVRIGIDKQMKRRQPEAVTSGVEGANGLLYFGFFTWLLAIVQVIWQSKYWFYHYHVILLPLCLLAAGGIDAFLDLIRRHLTKAVAVALTSGFLLLALAPYGHQAYQYALYHRLIDSWRARIPRSVFWATYTWGGTDYSYLETIVASQRIKEETAPTDSVLVWGFEPGIYFMSDRRPSTRFLYDYPLMPSFQSVHQRFMAALLKDIDENPPARVIILLRDQNAIENEDSFTQLNRLPALKANIKANYSLAWRMGDFICLKRN